MPREYVFPYRREPGRAFGKVARPVVELQLKSKHGTWFTVYPYADSGADVTLPPKSLCALLGLKYKRGKRSSIAGVAGKEMAIYLHRVAMKIGETEFMATVGFAERRCSVFIGSGGSAGRLRDVF